MKSERAIGLIILGGIGVYIFSRSRAGAQTLQQLGLGALADPVALAQPAGAGMTPEAARLAAVAQYGGPAGGGAPLTAPLYRGEYDAPSFGETAGRVGTTAGVALGTSVGTALVGPGTVAGALSAGALAATGIGAGAALLTWAIVKKGLFRGGEEGITVNPARDEWILQFGDTSWNPETSGWIKLSRILAEISAFETAGADNQVYEVSLMRPMLNADTMALFVPKTREIKALLARYGIDIAAY